MYRCWMEGDDSIQKKIYFTERGRERERRWLERSLLSQRFFVFPESSWELMMESLFIHPFFLFYHFHWVHPSFYNPPPQKKKTKSCSSTQIFLSCSLWEARKMVHKWMLHKQPNGLMWLFDYQNLGINYIGSIIFLLVNPFLKYVLCMFTTFTTRNSE